MTLEIVRTVSDLRQAVASAKKAGKATAIVPTMGGLHDGHLSLIKQAEKAAEFIIVSIFVNPTQFDNPDDLTSYPGDEQQDLVALDNSAAQLVYMPSAEEMYPEHFSSTVTVHAGSDILCDAYRPGHFSGVATVVAKLLLQSGANYAVFGEKDYQQLFKVKRLVADLNIDTTILPAPTIRETDGLAMSSRNARLTPEERQKAAHLHQAMQTCGKQIKDGLSPSAACQAAKEKLHDEGFRVEYLELRSSETLDLLRKHETGARLFAAAHLGSVRLIDNIEVT